MRENNWGWQHRVIIFGQNRKKRTIVKVYPVRLEPKRQTLLRSKTHSLDYPTRPAIGQQHALHLFMSENIPSTHHIYVCVRIMFDGHVFLAIFEAKGRV